MFFSVFSREFAKEKERVESRAGFMQLKEQQKLEKELNGSAFTPAVLHLPSYPPPNPSFLHVHLILPGWTKKDRMNFKNKVLQSLQEKLIRLFEFFLGGAKKLLVFLLFSYEI